MVESEGREAAGDLLGAVLRKEIGKDCEGWEWEVGGRD